MKKLLNIENLIILLIVFSGIFCDAIVWEKFNFQNENNKFYVGQLVFFMLTAGLLGAYLIYQYNKWVSWLAVAYSIGLSKTFLFANAPKVNMFESALIGFSAFFIYYFVRHVRLTEEHLKWFLLPAIANIALVFIQFFDNSLFFPVAVEGVSGFLGREGMTAAYLALCLPLFFKYLPKGTLFCFSAIIMCNGAVGLLAGVLVGMFYALHELPKRTMSLLTVMIILSIVAFVQSPRFDSVKEDVHLRASMIVGTVDGIMHNPVLGWGIGSFIPIMSKVKPEDSEYIGRRFNTDNAIMHHPHNEILSGWWKIGVVFPFLLIGAFWDFLKKYRKEFLMTFSIVLIGAVVSMGWFFTLPALFLFIAAFGVHENSLETE